MSFGILVLALTTLVNVGANAVSTECPAMDPTDHTILLAHETDCTKYYSCTGGIKTEMQCSPIDAEGHKLYFNVEKQTCDWPANVKCEMPESIVFIMDPKLDSMNLTVHLAHESDCTKFYKYLGGRKILMECPKDDDGKKLYFNPSLQVCDWHWNVECKHPQPSVLIRLDHPILPVPKECPKVDPKNSTVHLAHESDCTKFYKCSNGKRNLMDCPEDDDGGRLYFNPSLQVCDWHWNVGCKHPQPSVLIRSDHPILPVPKECPRVDPKNSTVHLAYHKDCTKFYKCSNGKKYPMDCPEDGYGGRLYFNPILQVCVWPEQSGCENGVYPANSSSSSTSTTTSTPMTSSTSITTPSPATSTSTTTSISTSSSTSTTTLPPPSSSTSTTIPPSTSTSTSTATSISTSSSTSTTTPPLSSSSTSTTIPPSTSTSTTTTTPSSTTLEPDPKDCEGDCLNNGLNAPPELNAHKICDKFCVCSSGQHFVASCELGDHWNEEKKACVRGNCTQDHTTPNYDMNDKIDDPLMYVLGYAERLGWWNIVFNHILFTPIYSFIEYNTNENRIRG